MSIPAAAAFAITAGLSVAQGVMSYTGQQAAYKAQIKQNQIAAENTARNTRLKYEQMLLQRQQERENAQAEIEDNRRDGMKARATALTSAGEAGVSGISVDALVGDIYARELEFETDVATNLNRYDAQLGAELKSVQYGADAQLASLPIPQKPNLLGAVTQTAAGVWNGYNKYYKIDTGGPVN